MSSRQLRKLQQQRELEQAKLQAQESQAAIAEESEEEPVLPTKSKASLFANLADLEDEDDRDELADEDEVDVHEEVNDAPTPPPAVKKAKKSKKKKKAKKNAKDKLQENEDDGGDSEDIDAVLRELDLKESRKPASNQDTKLQVDPEYERVCALLSIGSQHLKVANEMRNLFGKDFSTVDADEENQQTVRGARTRRRGQNQRVDLETALKGQHAPGKGLSSLTIRRNALIEGKQDWPRSTTGGLTMVVTDDKSDDGTVEFKFVHDYQYQVIQRAFSALVDMGDPEHLIGLLVKNPYHISTLLQVSKIAKDQGDHALSSDLLERALFSFGRAATSVFNTKLSQGKARLDFARPENREFWLAGYHYIKSLIMKGTYRTALEWSKLLLSLDPESDPYCMRLIFHQLALRAGENKWLLDVGDSDIPKIWSPELVGQIYAASHTTPSLVLAAVNLKQTTKCRELLSDSMQKLPWLFVSLFKEISLEAPKSIWGIMPRNDAETLFTELYISQTKEMWNTPEITALLMEVAHTIPKVDVSTIPKIENKEMTLDVVRFIYLENNPAMMRLVPSSLLHRDNNSDSDPLPPDVNVYSYEHQRVHVEGRRGRNGGAFADGYDPLAALGRLIPNFGLGQGQGHEIDDDEAVDIAALNARLREMAGMHPDDVGEDSEHEERSVRIYRPPEGLVSRVLNMLWGRTAVDEDESEYDVVDPNSAEHEHGGEESEDEMPDRVE
ncbi:DUF654-domain-containing protein [Mollisia scopiformis]|uniref:DUF654-domain-containing protein n=1 Tax=Mollisia scopiformis TaxID=149040 RepID=A0A194WW57_MOLSC|nr:DUF654-domain-containing protein [Mollisia scopiformis]KUJ12203.1 DUF654-domain-containing protein [Mollisia scopiformis]